MWRIIKTMMIYVVKCAESILCSVMLFMYVTYSCLQWRIQKFWKGGKTIYQLRPHLSQMRTTKYMFLHGKKRIFGKKIWANRGQPPPPPPSPFEYATGCLFIALHSVVDCNGFRWRRVWCWAVDSLWQTNWQLFMCWSRHSASWCTVCSQCWSRILPW